MITKTFYRWLGEKINRAQHEQSNQEAQIKQMIIGQAKLSSGSDYDIDHQPDLQFRISRAENGYVLTVRNIDRRTDRSSHTLYIINDNEDLGQSIAHIITVESLKLK